MNRRSFIKKIGLLGLVPFVPSVFPSESVSPAPPGLYYATEEMIDDWSYGGFYVPQEIELEIIRKT